MSRTRRLGLATVEVLRALGAGYRYGFDIMDATGLAGGTVYPALARLEDDRLVTSEWEDPETARAEKRPPRRYYRLTADGERRLEAELARLRRLGTVPDDASDSRAAGAAAEPSPGEAGS